MQKVIIAGSRDITDTELVRREMNNLWREIGAFEVVVGGARGVDSVAERVASAAGITTHLFPADWDRYGKSAGYRRNVQMAEFADYALIIWDGKSRGSKHMMDIMRKHGKPSDVVVYQRMQDGRWYSPDGAK